MRASRWIVGLTVAGGLAAIPAAASAAATHKCAAVTIGTDRFTHITAHGVTCKYARTVLIPALDRNVEPHGWGAAPPVHLSATEVKDTYVDGRKKKVVFDLTF
jgi:hypothetical protein